ncbi:MAG TPA: hypothetical protein PKC45_17165 [Gemmatales bacterium]|nr:hypothetical protein [Gemmatales bacterium]
MNDTPQTVPLPPQADRTPEQETHVEQPTTTRARQFFRPGTFRECVYG